VSVPVALAELAERVDDFGEVAYLVSVGGAALPHVVAIRARWDDGELVVGAGRQTIKNASARPDVTLLWPAAPGGPYGLIVDGTARVRAESTEAEVTLAIKPVAAVLHRTPEGDPSAPSCITVLSRS
jgi:hypothetical protein